MHSSGPLRIKKEPLIMALLEKGLTQVLILLDLSN
jgi:hypothetical protein